MNAIEQRLSEDRATRNAARAVFDANLAQVKADLEARSVGGRIADQATSEAKAALTEGLAVARESKGIVAGTVGALLAWFFRDHLLGWIEARFAGGDGPDEPAAVQEEPAKPRKRKAKPKEEQA